MRFLFFFGHIKIISFLAAFAFFLLLTTGVLAIGILNKAGITNFSFQKIPEYVLEEIIVEYVDGYSPEGVTSAPISTQNKITKLQKQLQALGMVSQEKVFTSVKSPLKNYYTLRLAKGVDVVKTKLALQNLEGIVYSQPNFILKTQAGSDPYYTNQWGIRKIQLEYVWKSFTPKQSIIVAIVDTGIDYNHEDLKQHIIKGYNFVDNNNDPMDDNGPIGHGTAVAGTIGAITNNDKGIRGVVPDIKLLAIKSVDKTGTGDIIRESRGLEYAVNHGAKVINISVAGKSINCNTTPGFFDFLTRSPVAQAKIYRDAIQNAIEQNVVVIVASGNDNENARDNIPSSCDGAIAIGATDQNDQRANFSNYGNYVILAAPGTSIFTTFIKNNYGNENGTSFSSPIVAGVAALILQANPSLTPEQIKNCLLNSADPITTDHPIGGRLNAYKALLFCGNLPTPNPTPIPTSTPTPTIVQLPSTLPTQPLGKACAGRLSAVCNGEPNNKLEATWNIPNIFGKCTIHILDKTGDHVISDFCTSNQYVEGKWTTAIIPGGSFIPNNGEYRLYVNNGSNCINTEVDHIKLSCRITSPTPARPTGGIQIQELQITPGSQ